MKKKSTYNRAFQTSVIALCFLLMGVAQSFGQGTYYWVGGNNTSGSTGTFNTLSNWNSTLGGGGSAPSGFPGNTFIIDGSNVGGGTAGTLTYINLNASLSTTLGPAALIIQVTGGTPATYYVRLGGSTYTLSVGTSGTTAGVTNALSVASNCTLTIGNGTNATTLQLNATSSGTINTATIAGTLTDTASSFLTFSQTVASGTVATISGTLNLSAGGVFTNATGLSTVITGTLEFSGNNTSTISALPTWSGTGCTLLYLGVTGNGAQTISATTWPINSVSTTNVPANLICNSVPGITNPATSPRTMQAPGNVTFLATGTLTLTSTITLPAGATITRTSSGTFSAAPTFGATVNLVYNGIAVTAGGSSGYEMPTAASGILNNLTINTTASTSVITIGASVTIPSAGTLAINSGTLAIGATFTLTVNGTLSTTLASGLCYFAGNASGNSSLIINNGTSATGTLAFDGVDVANGCLLGSLSVTHTGSVVRIGGTRLTVMAASTIGASTNLTIGNGTNTGTIFNDSLTAGAITISGTGSATLEVANGDTLTFSGTTNPTLPTGIVTVDLGGALKCIGTSGTLAYNATASTYNINGLFILGGTLGSRSGTVPTFVWGTTGAQTINGVTITGSALEYASSTAAQTINIDEWPQSSNIPPNIVINNTYTSTQTVTLSASRSAVQSPSTFILAAGTFASTTYLTLPAATIYVVNGTMTGTPTFASGANTNVIYSGTTTTPLTTGAELPTSSSQLNNLTFNASTSAIVIKLGLTTGLTVNGLLSLTQGVFNLNGYSLTLTGTVSSAANGSITASSSSGSAVNISNTTATGNIGTINFSGTSTAPLGQIGSLNMNMGTSGNPSVTIGSNLTIGTLPGVLGLTHGVIQLASGDTLTFLGTSANLGSGTGGNASSYVTMLGATGGFRWKPNTAPGAGTYIMPVGPNGTVSGWRPVEITSTGSAFAATDYFQVSFLNNSGSGSTVTSSYVPASRDNATQFILILTTNMVTGSYTVGISYVAGVSDFTGSDPSPISGVNIYSWDGVAHWTVTNTQSGNSGSGTAAAPYFISESLPFTTTVAQNTVLGVTGGQDWVPIGTYTWKGGDPGNLTTWEDAANWTGGPSGGTYPQYPGDNVIVSSISGGQPTLNSAVSVNNITMNASGSVLSLTSSAYLKIYGALTLTSGTVAPNAASTIEYAASAAQTVVVTGITGGYGNLTVSGSGSKTIGASLSMDNLTVQTGTNLAITGTTTVTGSLSYSGTSTITGGTGITMSGSGVTLNGNAGTDSITTPLTISGTVTVGSNTKVTNLTISGSASVTVSSGTLDVIGTTFSNSGTVLGPGAIQLNSAFGIPLGSGTGGTFSAATPVGLVANNAAITMSTGTNRSVALASLAVQGTGTLTIASGDTITDNGSFSNTVANGIVGPGTLVLNGTVTIPGTGSGTFSSTASTYPILQVGNGATTNTVTVGAGVSLTSLIVGTGAILATTYTVSVSGVSGATASLTCNGTISGTGTLSLTATPFTLSGTGTISVSTFNMVTTTQTVTIPSAANLTISSPTTYVNGNSTTTVVVNNNGTLNFSNTAGTLILTGGATSTITFNNLNSFTSAGTVSFVGLAAETVKFNNGNATAAGTVNLTNTSGGIIFSGTTNLVVWTNGVTGANSTLNIAGSIGSGGTFTATAIGNTVNYNSTTTAQTVYPTTYYNLSINKSSQTATLGGATVAKGLLTIGSGSNLDQGVYSGNNGLTIDSNFVNNGTLVAEADSITFGGTNAQVISGSATSISCAKLIINNSAGVSVSASSGFTLTCSGLTLSAGLLAMGNNTLIYTGTTSPPSGSSTAYVSFLGSSGGFKLNTSGSVTSVTFTLPTGISGTPISGYRPVTYVSSATPGIATFQVGFIEQSGGSTSSSTNLSDTANNVMGYIALITPTTPTSGYGLDLSYNNSDFNFGTPTIGNVGFSYWTGSVWSANVPQSSNSGSGPYFINKTSPTTFPTTAYNITLVESGITVSNWIGGASGNLTSWNTAANWSPSGVPSSTSYVNIGPKTYEPTVNVNPAAAKNLQILSGAVLTLGPADTLTVSNYLNNNGDIAGSATNTGALVFSVATNLPTGAGTIGIFDATTPPNIKTAVALTITAKTNVNNLTINTGGSVTMNSGDTLAVNGAYTNNVANSIIGPGPIEFNSAVSIPAGSGTGGTFNLTTPPALAIGNGATTNTVTLTASTTANSLLVNTGATFSVGTGVIVRDTNNLVVNGTISGAGTLMMDGTVTTDTINGANGTTGTGSAGTIGISTFDLDYYNGTGSPVENRIFASGCNLIINSAMWQFGIPSGSGYDTISNKGTITVTGTTTLKDSAFANGFSDFYNSGTMTVSGSGVLNIILATSSAIINTSEYFVNNSMINLGSGSLQLSANYINSTLSFTNNGTITQTGGGAITLTPGSSSGNALSITNNGTISQGSGGISLTGTSGGSSTFTNSANSTVSQTGAGSIAFAYTAGPGNTFANYGTVTTGTGGITGSGTAADNIWINENGSTLNDYGNFFWSGTATTGTITNTTTSLVDYFNTGSSRQSVTPLTYSNLSIDESSQTAMLVGAITVNGNLAINSGTLYDSTFAVTGNSSGTMTMSANTNLVLGSTASSTATAFPTYTLYTQIALDPTSTVTYQANTSLQTPSGLPRYGNLTIQAGNTAGDVRTLLGGMTVRNLLNINGNDTLSLAAYTLTMDSIGTITCTNGGGLKGGSASVISYSSNNLGSFGNGALPAVTGGLKSLLINRSGKTISLTGASGTVDSVITSLTLTAGVIATGTDTLSLASAATVAGPPSSASYVNGFLQWKIPTGSSITKAFPIGDASNYTPDTVSFNSVTTKGNLTSSTAATFISGSSLNSSLKVNRNWMITNNGLAFSASALNTVKLNWVSSDDDAGLVASNLVVGKKDVTTWTYPAVTSPMLTSITATGISSFSSTSDFEVGDSCIQSTAPASATTSATNNTICSGQSTILSIPGGGGGGSNEKIVWYTGTCKGTSVGTGNNLSVMPGGNTTYYVSYVDTGSCSDTTSCASVILTVSTATPGISASGPTTFCAGGSVSLDAGSFSSYSWNTGATSESITATSSGTYSVTVTNGNGCTGTASQVVTVNANPVPTITPGGATTFCAGGSVSLSAGVYNSYSWGTGATTSSVTATSTGTYTVTVTDGNTCTGTASQVVTVNALPVPNASEVTNVSCYGGSNGSVQASPTGGAGPYSYTWATGGVTTSSVTGLSAATYTVTVTDNNSCSATDVATVTQPSPVPPPAVTAVNNCDGTSTLSTTATGTLLWNTLETTSSITVSTAGTYSVTQTVGGCVSAAGTGTAALGSCMFSYTVKFFLQGYYIGGGKMSPLLKLLSASGNATDVDTVVVQLWSNGSTMAYADTVILQSNGNATCIFPGAASGNSYYIVIIHRNSIQTWSATAQTVSAGGSYDFTVANAAYGTASTVSLDGTYYGIYSGDVNQSGSIDASDKASLQTELSSMHAGNYYQNDITGDGFVDEDDYRILENNIPLMIHVQHP